MFVQEYETISRYGSKNINFRKNLYKKLEYSINI